MIDANVEFIEKNWGTGAQMEWLAPDDWADPEVRAAAARYERQVASPGAAAAIRRMVNEIDVRHVLPSIRVPTLVIHHTDNRYARVAHGRYLAEKIPSARYVELPGYNWAPNNAKDRDLILDEIEEFLTGARPSPQADRVLATVLFTDVVDSTRHAVERGDRAWRDLLERHRDLVRRQLERHRGREVNTTGDGFLATFDGPARAIQCASAIVQGSRALGVEIRAGLHTGEIELMGSDVGGISVHIGARVSALAGSGEVLVSSTVRDLVVGSGIEFDERGSHQLKGVPGEWRLYAVKGWGLDPAPRTRRGTSRIAVRDRLTRCFSVCRSQASAATPTRRTRNRRLVRQLPLGSPCHVWSCASSCKGRGTSNHR